MTTDLTEKEKVKDRDIEVDLIRRKELNDIRTVLSNASGRRLMWRLMGHCGTFQTIFNKESSLMAYLSGQQDIGHFLMSEIAEADEGLLSKLMKENKKES